MFQVENALVLKKGENEKDCEEMRGEIQGTKDFFVVVGKSKTSMEENLGIAHRTTLLQSERERECVCKRKKGRRRRRDYEKMNLNRRARPSDRCFDYQ